MKIRSSKSDMEKPPLHPPLKPPLHPPLGGKGNPLTPHLSPISPLGGTKGGLTSPQGGTRGGLISPLGGTKEGLTSPLGGTKGGLSLFLGSSKEFLIARLLKLMNNRVEESQRLASVTTIIMRWLGRMYDTSAISTVTSSFESCQTMVFLSPKERQPLIKLSVRNAGACLTDCLASYAIVVFCDSTMEQMQELKSKLHSITSAGSRPSNLSLMDLGMLP